MFPCPPSPFPSLHLSSWHWPCIQQLGAMLGSSRFLTLHIQSISRHFWLRFQTLFPVWPPLSASTVLSDLICLTWAHCLNIQTEVSLSHLPLLDSSLQMASKRSFKKVNPFKCSIEKKIQSHYQSHKAQHDLALGIIPLFLFCSTLFLNICTPVLLTFFLFCQSARLLLALRSFIALGISSSYNAVLILP